MNARALLDMIEERIICICLRWSFPAEMYHMGFPNMLNGGSGNAHDLYRLGSTLYKMGSGWLVRSDPVLCDSNSGPSCSPHGFHVNQFQFGSRDETDFKTVASPEQY